MRRWWPVLGAGAGLVLVLGVIGAPSPVLFGMLFGSLIVAISTPDPPTLPHRLGLLGQGLLGVSIGAIVDPETLAGFVRAAVPIAVAVVATIAVSIAIGQVLRLQGTSPATATFALIAGGASGVTAVANELGADERVVAVIQYLRVLIIVVGMPLVASVVFGVPLRDPVSSTTGPSTGPLSVAIAGMLAGVQTAFAEVTPAALGFTALCLGVGIVVARLIPFPAASLLIPLTIAAVLASTGVLDAVLPPRVPAPLEALAFGLIGLQVGLRFTRESLRRVVRLLPLALAVILVLICVSALIGVALARWIGVSPLDGYLATTPGGLYAVLVTATIAGGDVTFVLAVQVLRLLLVISLAPLLAAWFRRRASPA